MSISSSPPAFSHAISCYQNAELHHPSFQPPTASRPIPNRSAIGFGKRASQSAPPPVVGFNNVGYGTEESSSVTNDRFPSSFGSDIGAYGSFPLRRLERKEGIASSFEEHPVCLPRRRSSSTTIQPPQSVGFDLPREDPNPVNNIVKSSLTQGLLRAQISEAVPCDISSKLAERPTGRPQSSSEDSAGLDRQGDEMLKKLQQSHEVFTDTLVKRAFGIAQSSHSGQVTAAGLPTICHCLETAEQLAVSGMGPSVVAAGILHECLDRSMMTEEQLSTLISADVVELVVGVSKMSRVSELCREKNIAYQDVDIERLRTMILAMEDARVVVIKMCDRLMSLRRLDSFPPEMRAQFCEETMEVFVPLASRLGLWKLKSELEDTYFKVTNPAEHDRLLTKVATSTRPERIIPHISKLQAALNEAGIEASDLTGRPKNLYGIHKKMVKKGKTIDEVYDLRAMRVIVSDTKACYRALEEVNSIWQPLEGRTKDYIKNAKANGYQSLHTVVTGDDGLPFEIQIRTAEMHKVAEYGVAAHWRYKESLDVSGAFHDAQIAWARFVLSWTSELNDHKCRAEGSAKATTSARCLCPFPHHHSHCPHGRLEKEPHPPAARENGPIFVLVVDGTDMEVKELPAGSTKRDLLEQLMSGRLSSRASLIVNQEKESLDTPLNMGDLVELVHSVEYEFEKPLEKPQENCFDFWESQGVGSTDFFGGFDLPTSEYADFEHLDTSPAGIAKARARLSRVF